MVEFYNQQVRHFLARKEDEDNLKANDFIDLDAKKISWSGDLIAQLERGNKALFDDKKHKI